MAMHSTVLSRAHLWRPGALSYPPFASVRLARGAAAVCCRGRHETWPVVITRQTDDTVAVTLHVACTAYNTSLVAVWSD